MPGSAEAALKSGKNLSEAWSALRHRNFRLFWLGQVLSLVGSWMQTVAQAWLILELTNSAFMLGLVGTLQFAPILLFSLFTGVLADRFPKRSLLLATQSVMMMLALGLGLLTLSGAVQYWHVLVLASLGGLAHALDMPARQSFIIELVGRQDLMNAIALNATVFNGARVVGPAVAGILIGTVGIAACFLLNAASFVAVLIGLLLIRLNGAAVKKSKGGSVLEEIKEGLHYIKKTPFIRYSLALMGVMSVFAMNFHVLIPVFAREVLGQGAQGFGLLMSALGTGALAGSISLAYFSRWGPKRALIITGALVMCVSQIMLAPVRVFPLSLVLLMFTGWAMITFTASLNSSIQLRVPDHLRGRIMSVYFLLFVGMMPFGSLLSGAVARIWGSPAALALGAGIGLMGIAWLGRGLILAGQDQARDEPGFSLDTHNAPELIQVKANRQP